MNAIDPEGLYVGGVGLGAGGSYGHGYGSGDISYIWDDRGNKGFVVCYGVGLGSKGYGAYGGVSSLNFWGVDSVCDMAGSGFGGGAGYNRARAGGGAGPAINVAAGPGGININTGVGVGGWGGLVGGGGCFLLQC